MPITQASVNHPIVATVPKTNGALDIDALFHPFLGLEINGTGHEILTKFL